MEKVVARHPLHQQPRDTEHWLSCSPSQRLDAVETLRQAWLESHPMLSRDFKEFVALLNAHEIEYLVVGGYAMALHGRSRHTGNLDSGFAAARKMRDY